MFLVKRVYNAINAFFWRVSFLQNNWTLSGQSDSGHVQIFTFFFMQTLSTLKALIVCHQCWISAESLSLMASHLFVSSAARAKLISTMKQRFCNLTVVNGLMPPIEIGIAMLDRLRMGDIQYELDTDTIFLRLATVQTNNSIQILNVFVASMQLVYWVDKRLFHVTQRVGALQVYQHLGTKGGVGKARKGCKSVKDRAHDQQEGAPPLPCLRLSFEGLVILMTFRVTEMSQCHIVSRCVTYVWFHNCLILAFIAFLNFLSRSVTLCDSVTHVMFVTLCIYLTDVSNIIVMCHWTSNVSW
jgi:hypothetical protein